MNQDYKANIESILLGYYIKYHVMNAKDYGKLPQQRNRIYIVAFKNYEDNFLLNLLNSFSFFIPGSLKAG